MKDPSAWSPGVRWRADQRRPWICTTPIRSTSTVTFARASRPSPGNTSASALASPPATVSRPGSAASMKVTRAVLLGVSEADTSLWPPEVPGTGPGASAPSADVAPSRLSTTRACGRVASSINPAPPSQLSAERVEPIRPRLAAFADACARPPEVSAITSPAPRASCSAPALGASDSTLARPDALPSSM